MRASSLLPIASLLVIASVGCGSVTSVEDSGVPDAHGGDTKVDASTARDTATSPDTITNSDDAIADTAAAKATVTVAAGGNGTGIITSTAPGISCGADCTELVDVGTSITLHAAPAAGSMFVGWTGGGCSGATDCTLAVTADVTVQAAFTLIPPMAVALTVAKAGTGTGTVTSAPVGINCGATCAASYAPPATVTLSAVPGVGSMFGGWSGGGCTGTGPCVVALTAATTVTATFTLNQYTLTVSKTGNGTGTVTSAPVGISCGATCMQALNHGTSVTLTATPGAGSTFTGWTGGGCTGTSTCTVALTAATAVSAAFTLQQFTLGIVKGGTGGGTVTGTGISCGATCSASYAYGSSVILSATPLAGSKFVGWSGGVCTGTGPCTVLMTVARSVTATFDKTFVCGTQSNVTSCTNGATAEHNLGAITAAACHDQCTTVLDGDGIAAGCWVLAVNGNCYCRSGIINTGSTYTGGTCTRQ